MATETYLDRQYARHRREGVRAGAAMVAFIAVVFMILFVPPLVAWRCGVREKAVRAELKADMQECQAIVEDLSDEQYGVVAQYRREVIRAQRREE